jgi:UDP-GlcNAc:undecaprenyl-phosphate GlcNAc-1-phosphate transferase
MKMTDDEQKNPAATEGGTDGPVSVGRTLVLWGVTLGLFALYALGRAAAQGFRHDMDLAAVLSGRAFLLVSCALIAALSLAVALGLTPLFRALAWRLGVLDRPGEARKVHRAPVPYLGGMAFYAAFLAAALGIECFAPRLAGPALFPAAALGTVVMLMGLWDDARGLPGTFKLLVQLVLGAIFYFWGLRDADPFSMIGPATDWPWVGVIVTALWMAGVMNAVNFSDGLDGLAAGLVFAISAALFAVGLRNNHAAGCAIMACLMGATLGFLRYNFHPASIFMGDAGALFLGFILAAATLASQQKGAAVIALAVPMTALAVPVADTALSFLRRMRRARGGGFFRPDRDHLHHRLLALGLGQRNAVLALYGFSAAMGMLAYLMDAVPNAYRIILLVVAAVIILIGVAGLRRLEKRSGDR